MLWWVAQTTLIAGALAVLATLASRWKRLGPEVRHALWLVVLIKLALPPVVAWPWQVPDHWPSAVEPSPIVVARLEPPPIPVAPPVPNPAPDPVPPPAETVPMEPLPEPQIEAEPPLLSNDSTSPEAVIAVVPPAVESPIPAVADPGPTAPQPALSDSDIVAPPVETVAPPAVIAAPQPEIHQRVFEFWHLQVLLAGLWLAGSLVAVVRRAIKVVRFQRLLSNTTPAPEWLVDETQAIGDRLSVRPPPVVLASKVGTPLLWCLGRPRLILPEALVKRLEADRWAGILAHELAHLARRDHWVVRLELLIEAAWWWNPLFWHVRRKLHEEAELACDERVVRSLPDRRYAYAEALVDVCEHLARTAIPSPALGVGGAGASRSLEGRLLMILRDPIPRRPSRAAALVALLLAALALPAWTLGQQKPDDPTPQAETPAKPAAPETPAPKLDEPKPADPTPQAITPVAKPSVEAAEATIASIKTALDQRAERLKHLSFRYVIASRELRRYRTQANGGMVGMGGMEPAGMGGMGGGGMGGGGFRSMPPQFGGMMPQGVPGGSANNLESPQPVENRVRIEVADVVLDSGQASRLDVLEAWPAPANDAKPPIDFRWVRRFVAVGSGVTTLEMAWDRRGPVPFRWLAGSEGVGVGDSLLAWMSGGQYTTGSDRGLDPLNPRPANVLGLIGSSLGFVDPNFTRAEVAGIDMVDSQEAIRVAWIGANGAGIRGIAWYAPKLGFAPIRFDATLDPSFSTYPIHGRFTWRMRASDFAKVGDHWLPGKVSFEESEASIEAGEPTYRRELRIAFEDFNADQKAAANAAAKLTIQGLDDRTGQFTALPPEVPASLVERLKKAVADSPFGPPSAGKSLSGWVKPDEAPAQVNAEGGQPKSAQPAPGQPRRVNPPSGQKPGQQGPGQPQLKYAPRFVPGPDQQPAILGPKPAEPDAAQADPGIIAPPKAGFEDPIPVIKPETNDPIAKVPGDRAEIDWDALRKMGVTTDPLKFEADLKSARTKYDNAMRISRSSNDPAIASARSKLEELKQQRDLLADRSQEFRKSFTRSQEAALQAPARDAVPLLEIRRERKVAELQKAEAQRNTAKVEADQTASLKRKSMVSDAEAKIKDNDLAAADAVVAASKTELAEADLLLKQAKDRLETGKTSTTEAGDSKPLETLRDWAIADLEKAKAQLKQAKDVVASNGKPNQDDFDREQAETKLLLADFEVSKRQAALDKIEKRIMARDAVQADFKQPAEPKPTPIQESAAVDRDRIAILQARRDGKAADLLKAQAQKQMAVAVVTRNESLLKKDKNYVSTEDKTKADGELAIADAEVASKTAELSEAEILLAQAKRDGATATVAPKSTEDGSPRSASTLAELRDAIELLEVQLQGKQAVSGAVTSQADRMRSRSEIGEYQVRIKQAKRRIEVEEARLKREIERAKEELARAETLNKQGITGPHEAYVARARLDELMIQLDPSYVPTRAAAMEPKTTVNAPPVLEVKITGEKTRLSGQTNEYKIRVTNPGTTAVKRVKVAATMPQQGGKLVAIPAGAIFDASSRKLHWLLYEVDPGQSIDLTFTYMMSPIGHYRAKVDVTYEENSQVADAFATDVLGAAAVDLHVTQSARVIEVGKTNIYDITIKNTGTKEATKLQLSGKLPKNLKFLKAFNLEGGELVLIPDTGEFLFPTIERLGIGQTITRSLEVQATEAGTAGCHVSVRHAEMVGNADKIEDVISTAVTKTEPPVYEPKK